MFTAALFTITKNWKQPKCPSTDEQMNRLWSTPIVHECSTTKRNDMLTHTTWTNLENIMVSERSQTKRPHTWDVQNRQLLSVRKALRGCQGRWGGDTGGTINVYGVSFWCNENVLELITVMLAQSVDILKTTVPFKWVHCIMCELYHNTAVYTLLTRLWGNTHS